MAHVLLVSCLDSCHLVIEYLENTLDPVVMVRLYLIITTTVIINRPTCCVVLYLNCTHEEMCCLEKETH